MTKGTKIQVTMSAIAPQDIKGTVGVVIEVINEQVVYVNIGGNTYKLYTCDMIEVKSNLYNEIEVRSFDNQREGCKRRLVELVVTTKMFMTRKELINCASKVLANKGIALDDISYKLYRNMNLVQN